MLPLAPIPPETPQAGGERKGLPLIPMVAPTFFKVSYEETGCNHASRRRHYDGGLVDRPRGFWTTFDITIGNAFFFVARNSAHPAYIRGMYRVRNPRTRAAFIPPCRPTVAAISRRLGQ